MGYAMLSRWIEGRGGEARVADTIHVVTPHRESLKGLEAKGVHFAQSFMSLPPETQNDAPPDVPPDVIVFAVTPQIIGEVLRDYKKYSSTLFISVAAGKTLDFYAGVLGGTSRIIRAMPNLPAKCGEGATALVKSTFTTQADMKVAESLLSGLGMTAWLQDESLMDSVTALSGCGHAYFYALADVLAKTGIEMGLAPDLAHALAKQTFIGAAAYWKTETSSAETLYNNIAVEGGMTEAALSVLQNNNALKTLMGQAMNAAVQRGKDLGK
jgi:pyrroline-5-carboxylate reductase